MDFFRSQETAKRYTARLVLLFILAVLSLIVVTNLLVMVVFGFIKPSPHGATLARIAAQFDWQVFGIIGFVVGIVILAGSVYKTIMVSEGGSVIAEALGGRLITHGTTDLLERRTLNVVEEMAIASGTPVPPVYLLARENGINAFAAGFKPGDTVIGVTRGTVNHLTRDELQGVIAHEFSHILNGDMRLNMRLICILHGVLLIGLIGYYILRSLRIGSSKNTAPLLGLALGLIAIGFSGTFFGNLIKASVNRQREFLADAAAVQFTRNKDGIADALKKIGGYTAGSVLTSPSAPSMSHAYFSTGIASFMQALMATHPSLEERIRRIDPQWDGRYKSVSTRMRAHGEPAGRQAPVRPAAFPAGVAASALAAGALPEGPTRPGPANADYAAALIDELPQAIRELAYEPYGARAVIYALVINTQEEIQKRQLAELETFGDTGVHALVRRCLVPIKTLPIRLRLPLIDMALPSLRQLSQAQYHVFKQNLQYLVKIDDRIDPFEWSLQKILFHHLDPQFGAAPKPGGASHTLKKIRDQINILVSMLVHACVKDKSQVSAALAKAEIVLGTRGLTLLPAEKVTLAALDSALDDLATANPKFKHHLLKACLAIVTMDRVYSAEEIELMRAIGAVLDCPLPPFVPEQNRARGAA